MTRLLNDSLMIERFAVWYAEVLLRELSMQRVATAIEFTPFFNHIAQ